MLDLIEFIVGVFDLWYMRRIIAAVSAIALLCFGFPLLLNLPASDDFNGDLVLGSGSLILALALVIGAVRRKDK